SVANGSERASACRGNTPFSTPASRIRAAFSETSHHRSVAQTCTPNSRCRKIDDAARPQPMSRTRMPGGKSKAFVSHCVNHSEFAPPLTLANIHSGLYCEDRGKLVEMNRLSEVICAQFLHDAWFDRLGFCGPRSAQSQSRGELVDCNGYFGTSD